ncbi:hypothetical protein R5W23_005551 [Gemmata sp. JC673]|uniref:Uncharacterized protein n=1 Tax=Gemmata algarum TaxID=2975278 RepID=A0ABU5ETM1_9BACT|nr:hypothetical protein [Gemmata algarum]MDY3558436.1 hypothetical protein [Gemmata algarum]
MGSLFVRCLGDRHCPGTELDEGSVAVARHRIAQVEPGAWKKEYEE